MIFVLFYVWEDKSLDSLKLFLLICILTIQGQYPVFLHPEFSDSPWEGGHLQWLMGLPHNTFFFLADIFPLSTAWRMPSCLSATWWTPVGRLYLRRIKWNEELPVLICNTTVTHPFGWDSRPGKDHPPPSPQGGPCFLALWNPTRWDWPFLAKDQVTLGVVEVRELSLLLVTCFHFFFFLSCGPWEKFCERKNINLGFEILVCYQEPGGL